jgi:hypothetical protein
MAKKQLLELNKIQDVEIEGIDHKDAPKYCDAFIQSADYVEFDGTVRPLTDLEMDALVEEEYDWFYEKLQERLH